MTSLKFLLLILLSIFHVQMVVGQLSKTENEFRKYFKAIQIAKIDTLLIVKSGCLGCDVINEEDSKRVTDGKNIYVLTQDKGKFKLALFNDFDTLKIINVDTCVLFEIINQNKYVLQQKNIFYKKELTELTKLKFIPPRPSHYSYEELIIQVPNFKYDFMIVGKDADYLGFIQTNEKWFIATKTIIDKFYAYLNSINNHSKISVQHKYPTR